MFVLVSVALAGAAEGPAVDQEAYDLLKTRCFQCHGADAKGGLDLRTRASTLKGGKRGPALAKGKGASLLLRLVHGHAQPQMPPGSRLMASELRKLDRWVASGAAWPASTAEAPGTHWSFVPPKRVAVPKVRNVAWVRNPIDAFVLAALEKKGLRPSPPADRRTLLRRVTFDLTGLTPTPFEIAAFLGDRSPDAYEKVVRRLLASPHYGERWAQHWLDVVRFAETNGFELDGDRPQAWRYRDYVVRALNEDRPFDRFITEQVAGDELAPNDFEMRVATGFLRAGPAHVVGGNVDPAVARQEWLTEAVTGVGSTFLGLTIQCARCHDHKFDPLPQADYYRLQAFFAASGDRDYKPAQPDLQKAYEIAMAAHRERVKPIQEQIAAIEKPYRERLRLQRIEELAPDYRAAFDTDPKKRTPEQVKLAANVPRMLALSWDDVVAVLSPADRTRRAALRQQMHALDLHLPDPPPFAPGVTETLSPVPAVHVLRRGDVSSPGEKVEPAFPAVLLSGSAAAARPAVTGPASGRRMALARWLTQADHPLTGRVMVNRLWQHHFGRGLVPTPNDFGKNGRPPSHPELLDWLALRFASGGQGPAVRGQDPEAAGPASSAPASPGPRPPAPDPHLLGWSLKQMHFLMVTSNAYRQTSGHDVVKAKTDPENRLLWRMNRRRKDGESLRDAVLQAAGTLNLQVGGPSIRVPLEPEVYDTIFTEGEPDNLWPVNPDPQQHVRRSLYLLRKRNVRLPMLAVFDQPDMMTSCGARGESVHALQSLTLLNSDFMRAQSVAFARRLIADCSGDEKRMAERLFELTQARPPTIAERQSTERFLRDQKAIIKLRLAKGEPVTTLDSLKLDAASSAAWIDLCLASFNLNQFVYVQ